MATKIKPAGFGFVICCQRKDGNSAENNRQIKFGFKN
jgi:hypothetical protein